jgi:hypothetical protein
MRTYTEKVQKRDVGTGKGPDDIYVRIDLPQCNAGGVHAVELCWEPTAYKRVENSTYCSLFQTGTMGRTGFRNRYYTCALVIHFIVTVLREYRMGFLKHSRSLSTSKPDENELHLDQFPACSIMVYIGDTALLPILSLLLVVSPTERREQTIISCPTRWSHNWNLPVELLERWSIVTPSS